MFSFVDIKLMFLIFLQFHWNELKIELLTTFLIEFAESFNKGFRRIVVSHFDQRSFADRTFDHSGWDKGDWIDLMLQL